MLYAQSKRLQQLHGFQVLHGVLCSSRCVPPSPCRCSYKSIPLFRTHDTSGKFQTDLEPIKVSIVGPLYLVDLFFLHQRGRAFNALGIAMNMGASAGPTFSGFITVHLPWYDEYWWTIGLSCLAIILVVLFLEETSWDHQVVDISMERRRNVIATDQTQTWIQSRVMLFCPGTAALKKATTREMVSKENPSLTIMCLSHNH